MAVINNLGGGIIMNEIIRKRKSIRKYDMTKLDESSLAAVKSQIENVAPLYPDIRYSIEIEGKTKGLFNIAAPHYLVFRSEEKDGSHVNIGFIGQQLDLFFSENGLGACWLGASKPQEKEASSLPFVICMSFGKPSGPLHRDLQQFRRKTLAQISEGADERLEAARLAPSGINAQGWFFVAGSGKIHCYRKSLNPVMGLVLGRMGEIDLGIAICHIFKESENFRFEKDENAPAKKGYVYVGSVS